MTKSKLEAARQLAPQAPSDGVPASPVAPLPAGGQRFLDGAPTFPIGPQSAQEAAWNTLRRYRRQLAKMLPQYSAFIVESLHADLLDAPAPTAAPANGAVPHEEDGQPL